MKTKEKIVVAALELFNQQGERNVTTNHIAHNLSISPGNLYYHFRNKQEIVRAIFANYSVELLERFSPIYGQHESLSLFKHYLDSIFTLMWKYRFFYSNLPEILRRDEQLHLEYIEVQNQLRDNLVKIIDTFVEMGLLEVEKDEMTTFVTTLHVITTSWLNYQSAHTHCSDVSESIIHQGMLQMISVVKPKATEQGLEQLKLLEEGITAIHA
ncbi:TetR/AcrR family transcriptional regulator [Vibrio sp. RC27]